MSETLSCLHQKNLSLSETIDKIGFMGCADLISLQFSQLHGFQHIFTQAFAKLSSLSQFENLLPSDKSDPVMAMLDIISTYQSSEIHSNLTSSAEKLSLDFFFSQPADYFSRHFLFGTPSQKQSYLSDA